ncbi:alpha/beta hydrolase [Roseomonas sp. OT10]|uniref:alpha/beta fold hydrolase n=1 Tax=Roseomonas cutis TaxID=2897332 RepID=UPI001E64BF97|nr:alpha/beta hydrolase [Roseomonas sp. OT10]UFN50791.1 alpha/beta hydrolase [Roseomonas sp. OT10]
MKLAARKRRISARDGLTLGAMEWAGDPGRTPILCLPGISRTARDYKGLAKRHAGKRRVVALDYVGHGRSDRAEELSRYSPEHAIRDILDACAALGVDRAAVVGTSFGGLMAMFLAVVRPALLRGVVLNDIGPRLETGGLGRVEDFIGSNPGFASEEEAVAWLKARMPGTPIPDERSWIRFARRTFKRGEDGRWWAHWDTRIVEAMRQNGNGSGNGQGGAGGGQDFGPVFEALADFPVMLVWGERSELLGARTVHRMRAAKPDLDLVVLGYAGHAPTLEEPEVVPRLDAFLDRIA